MAEWYRVGRRVYHREAALLIATAERPEWAREIAALPGLLAALERWERFACDNGWSEQDAPWLADTRAAIAKAKGN